MKDSQKGAATINKADIKHAMSKHRHAFYRQWQRQKPGQRQQLCQQIARSIAQRQLRAKNAPTPSYEEHLPIAAHNEIIKKAILKHQVVVICGETGSGKTTQLPKILLELGYGSGGIIGHTQPRRIAARAVANRLGEELGCKVGEQIGCKIRFLDQTSDNTYIKVMTDGILLNETQTDRYLNAYDAIIIDEAHERSLNIDFLLAYLKRLLKQRADFKLIITSATIDPASFANYFNAAPIIEVSGRTYPVEICYRPLIKEDEEDLQSLHLQQGIAYCLEEIQQSGSGDVLVFLPSERAIRETAKYLERQKYRQIQILPLYGRLSHARQQRVFQPSKLRKVILATNVAETSITVPGIVYVIDSGLARISRYSYRGRVQRLPIEPISQASAMQRSGRCGRVSPGICYRLYSEDDFNSRQQFTEPEVLRTSLADVILQIAAYGLGSLEELELLDKPVDKLINAGYALLFELGATDEQQKITPLGRKMAKLPIDARLSRMLLAAQKYNSTADVLTICSLLSIADPRERPYEKRQSADEAHRQWQDPKSDFIAILNLWFHYQEQKQKRSNNQLRKWCTTNFVSYLRMREWEDIRHQLYKLLNRQSKNHRPHSQHSASYDEIHRPLLYGMLSSVGFYAEKGQYIGHNNNRFVIFPGSGLKTTPKWIMAAEIFDTSNVFAHTVATIQPQWIEQQAAHMIRHHYFAPFFHRNSGQVYGFAKVNYFALTLNHKKRINYAEAEPHTAREVFIRDALADMQLKTDAAFMVHNKKLVASIEKLQHKLRRVDLLYDLEQRIDYFEQLIPSYIVNAKTFKNWKKSLEPAQAHALFLNRQQLLLSPNIADKEQGYPDTLNIGGIELPLSYQFMPQENNDGVSLHIPLAAVAQIDQRTPTWLVPGMLFDKVCALIKTLPKNLRVNYVPVNNTAKRILPQLANYKREPEIELCAALANCLEKLGKGNIRPEDFNPSMLEQHYTMRFVVHDARGKTLKTGRNLNHLQTHFAASSKRAFAKLAQHPIERSGITTWDFATLPQTVEIKQQGIVITAYPALVDYHDSVAIELLDNKADRDFYHQQGLRRLFQLSIGDTVRYLRRNYPDFNTLALWYAPVGSKDALLDDILNSITQAVFLDSPEEISEQMQFELRVANGKSKLLDYANSQSELLVKILMQFHQLRQRVTGNLELNKIEAANDIVDQLEWLIYDGFLTQTPAQYLEQYPRYLTAIEQRLQRLHHAPERDRLQRSELQALWERFKRCWNYLPQPQAHPCRWAIEELRVSVFAQALGTLHKVSYNRVSKQLDTLEKELQKST